MTMGKQQSAATTLITQKPGCHSNRRNAGVNSRNSASDGGNRTIVYFASTPRPTTKPQTGHAHHDPREMRRPVPVRGLLGRQVKGAVTGQVSDVRGGDAENQDDGQHTAKPGWRLRDPGEAAGRRQHEERPP